MFQAKIIIQQLYWECIIMSKNERLDLWNKFENSGSISDYLEFVTATKTEDSTVNNIEQLNSQIEKETIGSST